MLPKFTARAASVMRRADAEAATLGHEYLGTEHVLLGLLREGGLACAVLRGLGIDPDRAEGEARQVSRAGPGLPVRGPRPHTPRLRMALLHTGEEAGGGPPADTGHLLLGLLHDTEGVAAQVLGALGPLRALGVVRARADEERARLADDAEPDGPRRPSALRSAVTSRPAGWTWEAPKASPVRGAGGARVPRPAALPPRPPAVLRAVGVALLYAVPLAAIVVFLGDAGVWAVLAAVGIVGLAAGGAAAGEWQAAEQARRQLREARRAIAADLARRSGRYDDPRREGIQASDRDQITAARRKLGDARGVEELDA